MEMNTIVRYSPLEIPTILNGHWAAKVPLHFVAEPSTVKSEGVLAFAKQKAEELNKEFFEWNRRELSEKENAITEADKYFIFADLRASETDIGELRLQDMRNGQNFITFKYNILFEALSNKKATGILFFDEMNLASNMIKAQFYKIINDRAVGDIPLSDDVLCVSAGNEAEQSRGVTEDPVPLVLRRGNYFLRPLNQEEWNDYAVASNHNHLITGYLAFQPNDMHLVKYDLPDSVGQPCPRTWTKLSDVLMANKNLTISEIEMFATGLVGQGVAKKFTAYVKAAKEINLNAIIQNPKLIKDYEDNPDDLSLVYAIISGVVEKFRSDKKVIKPAFEMSLHFERPEFGAFLLRSMKAIDKNAFMRTGAKDVLPDDLVKDVVDRYAKYLFK